jgi:hypothetical protein
MRIHLEFLPEQNSVQRARLGYAFSLFCAVCGHQNVSGKDAHSADIRISYSHGCGKPESIPSLRLGNVYKSRLPSEPAPGPKRFVRDSLETVLFYDPLPDAEPDWLAEVFEWVSCADEYSVTKRDAVGRVDFSDSYFGRHQLDVTIPHAAVAMRFLHRALCNRAFGHPLDPDFEQLSDTHLVVNTHDVDILPAGYVGSLYRLGKYSLISLLRFKSPKDAAVQAAKTLSLAVGGRNPLDQMPNLLRRGVENGTGATYFFIAGHNHRRDANYRISDVVVTKLMRSVEQRGSEVALHGSYTSLDRPGGLSSEFELLRDEQFQPLGNRQHWLRFTLDRLIPAVEESGALYDSSLGWDRPGFRAGACFAFPPYNFACERPATFLEIPLVFMEMGLFTGGLQKENWYEIVTRVLANSRQYGCGGISLLWHPTAFGRGQLPAEIERIYWELIARKQEWNDSWISCIDFVRSVSHRYIDAGLLPPEHGSKICESEAGFPGNYKATPNMVDRGLQAINH